MITAIACGAAFLTGAPAADPAETKRKAKNPAPVSLFNGDDLGSWKSIAFGGEGDVHVAFDGSLTLETGVPLTGVVWTGKEKLPASNYEITLEAKKHSGEDFFCGLTFPVGESHATFVCGGWGGSVTGISSIDGRDAADNETTRSVKFESGRWYKVRLRVTDARVTGWIDGGEVFDVERKGKAFSLRPGPIERCVPLGIASYLTRAAFRKIALRRLEPGES